MTEEFTPLAKRNQSLGLKAKAFFFCKKACLLDIVGGKMDGFCRNW